MIDKREILRYEVAASWWTGWMGWSWMQSLAASYFAWKVNRKYARYERTIAIKAMLAKLQERIDG